MLLFNICMWHAAPISAPVALLLCTCGHPSDTADALCYAPMGSVSDSECIPVPDPNRCGAAGQPCCPGEHVNADSVRCVQLVCFKAL